MLRWSSVSVVVLSLFLGNISAQIPNSAYVVNTIGENLSMINLDNQTVTVNAEPLGLFTNQVVVHGEAAYVINSGLNEVQVINLNNLNTTAHFDVGGGTNPWAIAFVNDTMAAVSLLFTNQVVFIHPGNGQILQTVAVGNGPEGMVAHGGKLYVCNSGFNGGGFDPGTVSVIQLSNFAVSSIPVGLNPQSLALDSQGNIVVACTGDFAAVSGEIDVIDGQTDAVVLRQPANTGITFVAVSGADKAYTATFGSGVLVYDLVAQTFERDSSNPLPGGPGIAFDAQDRAYITDFANDSVLVFSPGHQLLNSYLVGDGPISIDIFNASPTGIPSGGPELPGAFSLQQNFPNPFNPTTTIAYQLSRSGDVELQIFNILGQPVRTLIRQQQAAGRHLTVWDGRNDAGLALPSGVYLYRLKVGAQFRTRKMLLVD